MKVRGKRALLNPPGYETTGAIVAEVEDTRGWRGRARNGAMTRDSYSWQAQPIITLQISDCQRAVRFNFDMETKAGRRASLKKVDTMIDCLTQFREALADEFALYEVRARRGFKPDE